MKKYIGLLMGIVAFVAIIAGAGVLYTKLSGEYGTGQNLLVKDNTESSRSEEPQQTTEQATEPSKIMAIDFTMEDAEGEAENLLSFVGKPIVLNFWASWCGPCKNELPDFQAAYEKYDGKVQFLMVNMTDGIRETKEIASAYMEEQGYTLPVYFDTTQEAAYTYGVYSLPTTYFIAADGELIAQAQGMIDGETLEYGISMIYSGE